MLAVVAASPVHAQERGGDLSIGVVSDPVTLDPHFMGSFFEIYAQYLIHEPLLSITPELEIEPGMASVEVVDDLTYDFTLRDGLAFHDGTPLDAVAAKWNFERMLDPATGSPRKNDLGPVESVDVTGDLTFTVKFSEPYAPFLHVMTNRGGLMVSPSAVETLGEDFATRAVGAGPFKVDSWTKNSELVLSRFDGYWREGLPFLDSVTVRPIADETVRLANLRSNTVQLVDSVPPQNFNEIKAAGDLQTFEKGGVGFNAFSLNVTRPPFDDPSVRRALMHAVDPEVIQRIVFFDTGSIASGPIPPSLAWAHDEAFDPYDYDVEKAKALLAEAGVDTPIPFEITVINSPSLIRMAEIIQAQASEAGFAPTIEQIDGPSLIVVLRAKDFDMSWSPWSGRSDPDGNMFNWFTIGGPNNFAGYDNPEVDALMKKARTTVDEGERAALYREAEALIAADAPMLFVHFDSSLQAAAPDFSYAQQPDGSFRIHGAGFTQ
ncbi:MAG: ABC transporter substrate-binding protein [Pseudomonadota bacterium]